MQEALLLEAERRKIRIKCNEEVRLIRRLSEGGFQIQTGTWSYQAERVILAAGTQAAALSGFDDSGFRLSKQLGHHVLTPLPALVPLKIAEPFSDRAAGVRTQARLTLLADGRVQATDRGELQWTAYGISGIVVFQISRFAVRALSQGKKVSVTVDLLPDNSEEELRQMAQRIAPEFLLNGLFAKRLQGALLKACFGKKRPLLDQKAMWKLLRLAKHLELTVTGSRGFDYAQCCCGGVPVQEVEAKTLESRRTPGLYLTGELLDIDGMCGGYNLQWAWSTGYVAGLHASMPAPGKGREHS